MAEVYTNEMIEMCLLNGSQVHVLGVKARLSGKCFGENKSDPKIWAI